MVRLDTCNLCGGHGFLQCYSPTAQECDGREPRRCPACHGAGSLEPWRQAPVPPLERGIHGLGWTGPC